MSTEEHWRHRRSQNSHLRNRIPVSCGFSESLCDVLCIVSLSDERNAGLLSRRKKMQLGLGVRCLHCPLAVRVAGEALFDSYCFINIQMLSIHSIELIDEDWDHTWLQWTPSDQNPSWNRMQRSDVSQLGPSRTGIPFQSSNPEMVIVAFTGFKRKLELLGKEVPKTPNPGGNELSSTVDAFHKWSPSIGWPVTTPRGTGWDDFPKLTMDEKITQLRKQTGCDDTSNCRESFKYTTRTLHLRIRFCRCPLCWDL